MFTVCSKCNLRLTVTATDLRAAQGYVRCGRCHNVFNALAALADDPAHQPEQPSAADTQRRPVLTTPASPPSDPAPDSSETQMSAPDPDATDTSLEFNPASTNINEVFIEAAPGEGTGTYESIILEGEESPLGQDEPDPVIAPQALSAPGGAAAAHPDVSVDLQRMRDALAEPVMADTTSFPATDREYNIDDATAPAATHTEQAPLAATADAPAPGTPPDASGTGGALDTGESDSGWSVALPPSAVEPAFNDATVAARADEVSEADPLSLGSPASRLPRWVAPGSLWVLALCLIGQVVHHYRGELAQTALLHQPLTALYQALGQPLVAPWNIADYEIRQLGATTDGAAAGDLVVRASISNHASRDQPLPLLRVVMQDRFGNRVAGRDLLPAEYLGPGAPQVSLMAPGQRVDVQVAFRDPGQAATGFEIDACMARRDRTVVCANDPANH
ncbi:MAG TPA: zinc-ribbon and DUF3426 domain-containing protein [Steroidobacteraceae bacterium]|jgi:predicted Zn finger-like uncharacterized protein